MRKDIEFKAEDGITLRGWHYLPDGGSAKYPTIVMAHGFSAVKEMYLDRFAEAFVEAGLASVVFDNRNFGASDGEPRQEIDPWAQIRDYRDAITHAAELPDTDADRIGIWGSSYSGAHVLVVGAIDRRVKCVVSQVPLISGHANTRRLIRADASGFPGRPAGSLPRRGTGDDTRGRAGSAGSRGVADAGLVGVVHRDRSHPRPVLAQRGDPSFGVDVHRIRAGRTHRSHQSNAASACCRVTGPSDSRG